MRFMVFVIMILAIGGCASPSVGFLGALRQDITVDGMRFAVYARGTEAQVIRLDHLRRSDGRHVVDRMMRAAQQATGCHAIDNSLTPQGGPNSAVALIDLRCPP